MGLLQRLKERRQEKRELIARLKGVERDVVGYAARQEGKTMVRKGFFSKERVAKRQGRIAKRRDFRVAVSGNRKWMLIGLAAVVICITIIYLSVTYGGGILKFF